MARHPRQLDIAFTLLLASSPAVAQQGFTDAFPPEEFAARRERVIAQIGDGVAILQGTTERRGESPLRQSNQFFYLTGVTEPRAFLIIDGKARKATLFLTPAGASAGPRSLGHSVGMEVHDVRNPTPTLEPGYVFTIEPQMTMEGGELSVRLEDMSHGDLHGRG